MEMLRLKTVFGPVSWYGNSTMFHLIAEKGYSDVLDRINSGDGNREFADILKLKNDNGETCLHRAVKCLSESEARLIMGLLFDMGADLEAQEDGTRDTVLHIAVKLREYELVKWLLSMPIDRNITNCSGRTAYQIAEHNDDIQMMEIFLEKEEGGSEYPEGDVGRST